MEAHAGIITSTQRVAPAEHPRTITATRPRRRRLAELRLRIRQRRLDRAARAYSLRVSGARAPFVSGSEHTHMLRTKGF
jgi:hypothetical protein